MGCSIKKTMRAGVTLMRTIDRLNLRFGRDTVSFAVAGRKQPRTMQRARLSPCYTAAWNDLLLV
jgi:DNA polymerase V